MKLSDAILLGSMASKPMTGNTFAGEHRCAYGAALLAIGRPLDKYTSGMECWPWTTAQSIECPECRLKMMSFSAIRCLNDNHSWTRERIAEWVAAIEPQELATSDSHEQTELLGSGPIPSERFAEIKS